MFSASKLASFNIEAASFLALLMRLETLFFSSTLATENPPAIPAIPEISIVKMSMFNLLIYIKKAYIRCNV